MTSDKEQQGRGQNPSPLYMGTPPSPSLRIPLPAYPTGKRAKNGGTVSHVNFSTKVGKTEGFPVFNYKTLSVQNV